MKQKIALFFGLALGLIAPHAVGQPISIKYDGDSEGRIFQVGSGFEVEAVSPSKQVCMGLGAEGWLDPSSKGAQVAKTSYQLVESYDSFVSSLNVAFDYGSSTSANISDVISASSDIHVRSEYSKFFSQSSDNFAIVIQSYIDYGLWGLTGGYKLKSEYQTLVDRGDIERFRRTCGTHFVGALKKWRSYAAIITFEGIDTRTREELKTQINIAMGGKISGIGSGSSHLNTTYNRLVDQSNKSGKIRLNVIASGGDGESSAKIPKFDKLHDVANLEKIRMALEDALKGTSRDTSAIKEYILMDYNSIGVYFDTHATDVYSFTRREANRLAIINSEIDAINEQMHGFRSPSAWLTAAENRIHQLLSHSTKVKDSIKKCVTDKVCVAVQNLVSSFVKLPQSLNGIDLKLHCHYGNLDQGTKRQDLIGISVIGEGTISNHSAIPSLVGANVTRLIDNNIESKWDIGGGDFRAFNLNQATDTAHVIVQLGYERIEPIGNIDRAISVRDKLAKAAYVINGQDRGGHVVSLGVMSRPPAYDCPIQITQGVAP